MAEIISAIVNILYHMKLIGCYFFLVLFFIACAKDSSTEKFQSSRNNIVDVRGQIVAIELENPGISLYTYFQIVDSILFSLIGKDTTIWFIYLTKIILSMW